MAFKILVHKFHHQCLSSVSVILTVIFSLYFESHFLVHLYVCYFLLGVQNCKCCVIEGLNCLSVMSVQVGLDKQISLMFMRLIFRLARVGIQ